MSTYTPTPASITAFTAVTDGSTEDAALFAPFLEGLANQAAWVADGGDASALNWSNGGATAHNLKRMAYYAADDTWFGVGDGGSNFLESSVSFGRSWTDLAATLAAIPATKICEDIAVNSADGSITITTSTRDTFKGTRTAFATYSWALTTNAITTAPTASSLAYEPTAALMICFYRVITTGFRVDTSTDGVTWVNRAVPASFSGSTVTNRHELGVTAGRAIAVFPADAATAHIETAYSTDGGVTWTGVTLTSGIAPANFNTPRITRPVYDTNAGLWWFAVSSTTADVAEVWSSSNGGVSWAVVKTFTAKDVEVQSASMVGPAWAMCTKKGRIMVSKDYGATWRWVAANDGTASNFAMRGNDAGALVLNAADRTSFRSHRAGRTAGIGV